MEQRRVIHQEICCSVLFSASPHTQTQTSEDGKEETRRPSSSSPSLPVVAWKEEDRETFLPLFSRVSELLSHSRLSSSCDDDERRGKEMVIPVDVVSQHQMQDLIDNFVFFSTRNPVNLFFLPPRLVSRSLSFTAPSSPAFQRLFLPFENEKFFSKGLFSEHGTQKGDELFQSIRHVLSFPFVQKRDSRGVRTFHRESAFRRFSHSSHNA